MALSSTTRLLDREDPAGLLRHASSRERPVGAAPASRSSLRDGSSKLYRRPGSLRSSRRAFELRERRQVWPVTLSSNAKPDPVQRADARAVYVSSAQPGSPREGPQAVDELGQVSESGPMAADEPRPAAASVSQPLKAVEEPVSAFHRLCPSLGPPGALPLGNKPSMQGAARAGVGHGRQPSDEGGQGAVPSLCCKKRLLGNCANFAL